MQTRLSDLAGHTRLFFTPNSAGENDHCTHLCISNKYLLFIKQLRSEAIDRQHKTMGEQKAEMSNLEAISPRKRVQLQNKLMRTLKAEIHPLSTEMQQILCDDLVTALQNRLIVLSEAEAKSG